MLICLQSITNKTPNSISFWLGDTKMCFLPEPGKMLITPLGIPALTDSSANFKAVSGVT